MNVNVGESMTAELTIGPKVEINSTNVKPLDYKRALQNFTEPEQKEIVALSERIDVTESEKIMSYGSIPMIKTFEHCGEILKKEQGSHADQKVIKEVIELSQAASKSYEDFNIALKEPGFIEKLLLKISTKHKKKRAEAIKESAITNYELLTQLKVSCDSWLEMLKQAYSEISFSSVEDRMTLANLEKYIIAGNMAIERIESDLEEKKIRYEESGLQKDEDEYSTLKEGYDIFKIVMTNLEKSRVMYKISLAQLKLIERSNKNMQIAIHTQQNNSMALISQQLKNAILDAKNREVLEGQRAITRLNDELLKKVTQNVSLTAEETEKLIYAGFYNLESANAAINAVISSCQEIRKIGEEMAPKLDAELKEANRLIAELDPYIYNLESKKDNSSSISTSNATISKSNNPDSLIF